MAKFLGGEIQVQSEEGKGSTFTLYLPEELDDAKADTQVFFGKTPETHPTEQEGGETSHTVEPLTSEPISSPTDLEAIGDDRRRLSPGDKSILIIEDDPKFVKVLRDLSREKGFKALVAGDGETGLHLADYYKPSAIILDIGLPGIDGWTVMSRLKDNSVTRHIPVHFISASDNSFDAMKMGGIGYLTKPVSMENLEGVFGRIEHIVSKRLKRLLVVEDDETQRKAIVELIGNGDVRITAVSTGQEAYEHLRSGDFDCMILDLGLPDMSGVELLDKIRNDENPYHLPIVIYTGKELTKQEQATVDKYAEKIIIKGVRSPERLLDETSLFLHRVEESLPEEKRRMLRMIHDKESILNDKKILLVDDDMRNVYALANILEEKGVRVLIGKNGQEGLECLKKNPDVDLVLMDIMMPEMDGYEAMKEIRKQKRFRQLPIIALTAKAMRGDRTKCIESGANDYLSKPVDTDKLLSMLRVWLY
jgi:tubulin-specific chaperone A